MQDHKLQELRDLLAESLRFHNREHWRALNLRKLSDSGSPKWEQAGDYMMYHAGALNALRNLTPALKRRKQ